MLFSNCGNDPYFCGIEVVKKEHKDTEAIKHRPSWSKQLNLLRFGTFLKSMIATGTLTMAIISE